MSAMTWLVQIDHIAMSRPRALEHDDKMTAC